MAESERSRTVADASTAARVLRASVGRLQNPLRRVLRLVRAWEERVARRVPQSFILEYHPFGSWPAFERDTQDANSTAAGPVAFAGVSDPMSVRQPRRRDALGDLPRGEGRSGEAQSVGAAGRPGIGPQPATGARRTTRQCTAAAQGGSPRTTEEPTPQERLDGAGSALTESSSPPTRHSTPDPRAARQHSPVGHARPLANPAPPNEPPVAEGGEAAFSEPLTPVSRERFRSPSYVLLTRLVERILRAEEDGAMQANAVSARTQDALGLSARRAAQAAERIWFGSKSSGQPPPIIEASSGKVGGSLTGDLAVTSPDARARNLDDSFSSQSRGSRNEINRQEAAGETARLDSETVASLVNEVLIAEARRNGVDLS